MAKKKTYQIPIWWSVEKIITVKAKNLKEAIAMAEDDNLEGGEYIDSSFEINHGCIPVLNGDTPEINKEVKEL